MNAWNIELWQFWCRLAPLRCCELSVSSHQGSRIREYWNPLGYSADQPSTSLIYFHRILHGIMGFQRSNIPKIRTNESVLGWSRWTALESQDRLREFVRYQRDRSSRIWSLFTPAHGSHPHEMMRNSLEEWTATSSFLHAVMPAGVPRPRVTFSFCEWCQWSMNSRLLINMITQTKRQSGRLWRQILKSNRILGHRSNRTVDGRIETRDQWHGFAILLRCGEKREEEKKKKNTGRMFFYD